MAKFGNPVSQLLVPRSFYLQIMIAKPCLSQLQYQKTVEKIRDSGNFEEECKIEIAGKEAAILPRETTSTP